MSSERALNTGWREIFEKYGIWQHDFSESPFPITAGQIKAATGHLKQTTAKEVRILCTQTNREMRPDIFQELGLFILPIKNGKYVIIKGEGYVDVPPVQGEPLPYTSKLNFPLLSSFVGNSEMQHLDYAYAVSMVRDFMDDPTLVLTIRGRKYTPEFSFKVGKFDITVNSVQTEVDSGYEGRERVVLIEAKNTKTTNTIIRQLYYPCRQWKIQTGKDVSTVFFEKRGPEYHFWEFMFDEEENYNSIRLQRSIRYRTGGR